MYTEAELRVLASAQGEPPVSALAEELDRSENSDRSGVHRKQTSARRDGERVTRDALAVATPIWMIGDSAHDMLDWQGPCAQQVVVPVAPYNARNTDDPKDIEYRVEDRIEKHSGDVQLKQSTLRETYNRRTGVERTNESVKNCGLGRTHA